MAVVIKTKENTLIWLDATLSFSEDYSGSITSHPVQDGSVITDHVVINNPKLNVSGVISDFDFHLERNILSNAIEGTPTSLSVVSTPVVVKGGEPSLLSRLTPQVLSNLVTPDLPNVVSDETPRPASYMTAKEALKSTFNKKSPVTLVKLNDIGLIEEFFEDFVITSLGFQETPDTGEALDVSLTLEKVKFVIVGLAVVPKAVSLGMEKAAAVKEGKGDASGSTAKSDKASAKDAKEKPKELSSVFYDLTSGAIESVSDGLSRVF